MADKLPLIKSSTPHVPQQLPAADTLLIPDNIKIEDRILLKEQSSAPSETAGYGSVYTKQDGNLYYKNDDGVEAQICVKYQSFSVGLFIPTVENKTYTIGQNMPFAGSIKSITTKAGSGTCTITGKISGVNLGGTANSASTSEQTQSHSSTNAFSVSDDIAITASSNSSCTDLAITIEYERVVLYVNPSNGLMKYALSFFIGTPENKTYTLIRNSPFAGTIKKITTKSVSGTCTVTGKINGTALGGTANSASSSEQEQSHSSSNSFSSGDDVEVTVSSNSTCVDLVVTVEYERYTVTTGLTDTRYGTEEITMGNTYVDVTFDVAMANTNYVVAVEVPYQTSFWVTNKATTGFRINVGTSPGYSETLGWSVRPIF